MQNNKKQLTKKHRHCVTSISLLASKIPNILFEQESVISLKEINGHFQVKDHLNLLSHRINDPKTALWEIRKKEGNGMCPTFQVSQRSNELIRS